LEEVKRRRGERVKRRRGRRRFIGVGILEIRCWRVVIGLSYV